ncbi:ABC-type transport auxiliary lipoprotein family protein [Variovorax dokdonensis]|uniref:ABC-type transport auxiliary lipoprotein family protein n=1 Tax=Variovorax dokdonensis TaxID=344883 RepID=A0ABT7NGW3_9BURK|nr:ABC-type transport auxiliary lipoprotein family protein [Variovorax dokdonensis]MDM0047166.1 ABC-type transport auxiliary lipoprotein family protein [Variovorax dokdonensis]
MTTAAAPTQRARQEPSHPARYAAGRLALASLGIGAALVLGACASAKPPTYYTLAEPVAAAEVIGGAPTRAPLAIDVAPIQMAQRWARPQLVVRQSGDAEGRAHILEEARWTSTFESEMRDALAAGVAGRLGALDLSRTTAPREQTVYRVAVQMLDYDAQPDGQVRASFNWTLRRTDTDGRALACSQRFEAPAANGVDGVALATRRITSQLAGSVARGIAALADGRTAATAESGTCR